MPVPFYIVQLGNAHQNVRHFEAILKYNFLVTLLSPPDLTPDGTCIIALPLTDYVYYTLL